MKVRIKYIGLLLIGCLQLKGQNLTKQQYDFLTSVAERYQEEAYAIDVRVSTYDIAGNLISGIQENLTAKKNNQYLTKTPVVTTLVTEDYQLVINHIGKLIQFTTLSEEERVLLMQQQKKSDFSLDSFEGIEVDYSETASRVTLQPLVSFYGADVTYHFDKEKRVLQLVEYEYDTSVSGQPQKVLIQYQNFRFNEAVESSLFQLSNYIEKKGDAWQGTGAFTNYQLIKTPKDEN